MRNLGIALGNAASSAQSSFGNFIRMKREADELRAESDYAALVRDTPKPGDVIPETAESAQIERARTTFGLPEFGPEVTREGRIAALRDAAVARGVEGGFTLQPERRMTQSEFDERIATGLQRTGTLRGAAMGSQLRSQAVQTELGRLNLSREQFETLVLRAKGLFDQGQEDQAQATLAAAYNIVPNGMQGTLTRTENGSFVARIVDPNGREVQATPFANLREALDGAFMAARPENYRTMLQIRSNETIARGNNQTTLTAAGITAGAARYAADVRAGTERDQFAAGAELRAAQVRRFTTEADRLAADLEADRNTQGRISEYTRLLMEDPFNPRLAGLRTEITLSARDPSRLEFREGIFNNDGVKIGERTLNRLDRMATEARGTLTPGESAAGLLRHTPADQRPALIERIRRDANTQAPGSFDRDILPRIREFMPAGQRDPSPTAPRASALPPTSSGRPVDTNASPVGRGIQAPSFADTAAARSFNTVWGREAVTPAVAARAKEAAARFPDLFTPEQREWLNSYTPPARR